MFIRDYRHSNEIIAGDGTHLTELFNPLKDDLELRYSFAVARLGNGETSILHRLKTSEVYYILVGSGEMFIGDEQEEIHEGQVIYVPPNTVQRIKNTGIGNLEFICIVDPAWCEEDEEIIG